MLACKTVMIKGVYLNGGTQAISFLMGHDEYTTEIEANDNDAAPLLCLSNFIFFVTAAQPTTKGETQC